MSSYNFERGRGVRQGVSTEPLKNTSTSRIPAIQSSSSMTSQTQVTKPLSLFPRSRRGSSASDNNDAGRLAMYNPRSPLSADERSSTLPRPSTSSSVPRSLTPGLNNATPSQIHQKGAPSAYSRFGKSSQPEGRPRNVLRRKAPSIEQYSARSRGQLDASDNNRFGSNTSLKHQPRSNQYPNLNMEPHSMNKSPVIAESFGQQQKILFSEHSAYLPHAIAHDGKIESKDRLIPKELAGLSTAINTTNLPPPTPVFTSASSPSTRYSGSPGIWSSRGSTPTSLSSYSPGIVQPAKVGTRLREPSPTILQSIATRQVSSPIARTDSGNDSFRSPKPPQKAQTHPPLKISATRSPKEPVSASSNDEHRRKLVMPHSPPPRKSSTKFKSPNHQGSEKQAKVSLSSKDEAPRTKHAREDEPLISPPSRPSRAGAGGPDPKPSTVIQSNLSSSQLMGHRREGSSTGSSRIPESTPSHIHQVNSSTESFQSRSSERPPQRYLSPNLQPRDYKPTSAQNISSNSVSRRKTLLVKEPKGGKEPSSATSSKRFGMFSKRSKTVADPSQADTAVKQTRRGPSAGTGHEGYGKYAQRGRRPSVSSSTGRARSTSTSASTSKSSLNSRNEQEMDDFLLDRLEPVIINGGGLDGAELNRIQSNISVLTGTNYADYPQSSQGGYSSESLVSPTSNRLVQSPESFSSVQHGIKSQGPTFSSNRSPHKAQPVVGAGTSNVLSRLDTNFVATRPSIDSTHTSNTSISETSASVIATPGGSATMTGSKLKSPEKKRRWNFFQRSHHVPQKGSVPKPSYSPSNEVAVSVSKVPATRTVAHYAMVDDEQFEPNSLEDIIHRAEESPPTEEEETVQDNPVGSGVKKEHGQSVLLPSPPPTLFGFSPERRPSSPKVLFDKQSPVEPRPEIKQRRQNRLASVGRIPNVVSRGEGQHRPVIQSFSRPFSQALSPSFETSRSRGSPSNAQNASRVAHHIKADIPPAGGDYFTAGHTSSSTGVVTHPEFLAFSPRKGSEVSGSSSSDGRRLSLAAVTAIVPTPGSTRTEDEDWTEYDDLLDNVLSPIDVAQRQPTSPEASFEMATLASKALQAELGGQSGNSRGQGNPPMIQTMSPERSSASSVRLRRSMIQSALHSSITPSTTTSFSDISIKRDDQNPDTADFRHRDSLGSIRRAKSQSQRDESTPITTTASDRRRDTFASQRSPKRRETAAEETNLRSGSLMTSRWLSFGRVLFSPANDHILSVDHGRILVIDGLGNDDWSFYCSLTYPNAIVYNLTTSPPRSTSTNPAAWQPPSNHRSIYHPSAESPFPFPKGFFTVAVIRFPAACSEYGCRNTISECKRVLKAGGYLEMSVIDLDMVNMGNRARKAMRMLKERMYVTDLNVSLKPAADHIQSLLGKRGFQNLNRCMVGVPVSGAIPTSSDTSSSNQSITNTSTKKFRAGESRNAVLGSGGIQKHKRWSSDDMNVSLGDLLTNSSSSASNDESISKMVARVARWWWTSCYESWLLAGDNACRSIFADRRLLRECQRRGTSFRLLIAYAQKPSEMPRRTVSV